MPSLPNRGTDFSIKLCAHNKQSIKRKFEESDVLFSQSNLANIMSTLRSRVFCIRVTLVERVDHWLSVTA